MKEAVQGYNLPSRTKLSHVLVPCLHDDTKEKVQSELRKALEGGTSTLAVTSDIWTSHANKGFL